MSYSRDTWQAARKFAQAAGLTVHSTPAGDDFVQRKADGKVVSDVFMGDFSREDAWVEAARIAAEVAS